MSAISRAVYIGGLIAGIVGGLGTELLSWTYGGSLEGNVVSAVSGAVGIGAFGVAFVALFHPEKWSRSKPLKPLP